MPKLRVYEVAKDLDINSGRVIEKLKEIGIEVKNHMSTLDDGDISRIKEVFRKKTEITEPPKPPVRPAPSPSNQEAGQRQSRDQRQQRPQGYDRKPGQGYGGQRRQGGLQGQGGDRPPRPQNAQGTAQGAQNRQGQSDRPQGQGGDRPQRQGYDRPQRPQGQGDRPQRTGQRPQGAQDRPPRQGYQQRPQGQGYDRPQGQRPQGQGYDRPQGQRPQGQGYDRPQGQRPQGQGYDRPQGQRPQGQGYDRPQGQRPQGQGYDRPQGQRPQGQGYDRPQRPGGASPGQRQGTGQQGARPQGGQGQRPARPGQRPGTDTSRPAGPQKPGQRRVGQRPGETDDRNRRPGQRPGAPKPTGYKRQDISKPAPKTSPKSKHKAAPKPQPEPEQLVVVEDGIKILRLGKTIQVKDLASRLDLPSAEIIKHLMKRGMMVTLNEEIDYYTAAQIAEGYGAIIEKADEIDVLEQAFADDDDDEAGGKPRPPIVVVMGHVDHGKTSLLDRIRKSSVVSGEAGGITQHIGAYTVAAGGKNITFLDTPGHEAFTAMRMRGARVTDIAILVVAADDGVMPQTIEAINHAKAAGVEIIVAINKIDKPSANPDRVKQELTEHGILVEEWGGEIISCPVSALNGEGIEHLLEMILLVAEMKELKANPNRKARGTVIEALLDKTRGPIATVLMQSGTLRVGDPVVAGSTYGKVRAMIDDKGRKLKAAGPSTPVEILGLSEAPRAGDMFYTANSEKHARQVAESVVAQGREDMIKAVPKVSLSDLFNQIQAGNVKDLNVVVKADVQGSVEAVKNSLERLSNDEVRIRTLHGGVGAITESDVMLASASNAIIIGFNVKPENNAKAVADTENVDIRLYKIIYNAIEDITAAMKGMLAPVYQEKIIGHAEIRQIFKASGVGNIAGSYITDGKFVRNAKVRIFRGEEKIFEGGLETLKRFKDDVKEVASGYECGLLFTKFNDIQEGDKVEAYVMEEVPR